MDLTSSKLRHKARKNKESEVHKDLKRFCGKNKTFKPFECLRNCKANATKMLMLENKTFCVFKDATCKG